MKTIAIIGGGAAGFFAAIRIAETNPELTVCIYEKSANVLGKVRVSGGGRCNVTHECFDVKELVKFYPRGEKALIGPFTRFNPKDTILWFEAHGVELKTEADGRMFPVTDNSETIIECLTQAAENAGVKIKTQSGIESFEPIEEGKQGWKLIFKNQIEIKVDALIISTGSSDVIWNQFKKLGIKITDAAPSLFTFNIKDNRLYEMAGVSVSPTKINVVQSKLEAAGPLLITHWGMSGPGILKLSAWGARVLQEMNYKFSIRVNWVPDFHEDEMFQELSLVKSTQPRRSVGNFSPFATIPRRLWMRFVDAAGIAEEKNWADITKQEQRKLAIELTGGLYEVNGKSTNKEEFVTCGGIDLKEIDFKTMQIKRFSNLYVAGEVIDVDALTGGFNFQNAWTTGWIAGSAVTEPEL